MLKAFAAIVSRAAPALAAFAVIAAFSAMDGFAPLEHALMDQRFKAHDREATGKLVIVEIDARSLEAHATWPWPRRRHAELIDALVAAGAERIAFDVDFSSRSNPVDDVALAAAIERAGGRVILPAFGQRETTSQENTRTLATEPLPEFRKFALIGHVNIWPLGSLARTVRAGVFFDETYRPAMAALVSDQMVQTLDERYIDFSIDPHTIPRISFSDIILGRADKRLIQGRTLIVGGTAIELGDRLPVPVYGVLPGVTVQALAAESMSQGRSIVRTSVWVSLGAAFAVLLLLQTPALTGWERATAGGIVVTAALLATAMVVQDAFAVSIDIGAPLAMTLFGVVWAAAADLIDRQNKLRAERARSAARQALIRHIVEDSSDGILAVDLSGRIMICNAQAAALFGQNQSALQETPVENYLPISAQSLSKEGDGPGNVPLIFEHHIALEGRSEAIVEAVVNRSAVGESTSEPVLLITLRDVTLRKRMQEAEKRAAEEKLMAERAKSLFIANMSHELRTPLNAIIGFSEILGSESLGALGNPKYKEYAEIVLKSGQHLLDMVNNVLEISRLESGGIRPEGRATDIEQVVESCFAFIRNGRDFQGQILRFEGAKDLPRLVTDPRLVRQILVNLLSNALKFAPPDRKNTAVVSATLYQGGVRISVSDDGVGMSPATLNRVTDLFFQGDGSFERKHEGRGLGLYLVKKHVELLGGALSIASEPGKGTTVTVDLPDALASRVASAA